jgi:hypothetical protein
MDEEVQCPKCKTMNNLEVSFCIECGRPIQDLINRKIEELIQNEQKEKE